MSALMSVLIESIASGRISPANLVSSLKPNEALKYGEAKALFKKVRPGLYEVHKWEGDKELPAEEVTTPVEAKLVTLEHVIAAAREEGKKSEGKAHK